MFTKTEQGAGPQPRSPVPGRDAIQGHVETLEAAWILGLREAVILYPSRSLARSGASFASPTAHTLHEASSPPLFKVLAEL